ncbi:hypothetical protein H2509_13420 [Stappia sp. F7233]|uniref:Uncharacterized protein n=1 Tax=Stappia albiluteola TaxID=2758565 RepID=A0A839AHW4_9HYPH|nr:hypothetical protein [Stappia albiluteola]MBA5777452.1 hypothetical protein [Stappia albiluteola]MBA5777490.1 hypothetical protein [Stappia albiluteola]MBA5778099.1 hypothetical protein [Stappia albiluteola]MBA5778124.1 hypothetical protein [Stappia albiluteola]
MTGATEKHRALLERALAELRHTLRSDVECACELERDWANEIIPVPGTCDEMMADLCERQLNLVRDIQAEIGGFAEHPEPQWLDDLIDGRWSLT